MQIRHRLISRKEGYNKENERRDWSIHCPDYKEENKCIKLSMETLPDTSSPSMLRA